ncbi:MAG TPA: hypothetical protein VG318_00040 [Actinomycetota bacterium]|nr:hypothetical protein [Actinomycetota bacterium]
MPWIVVIPLAVMVLGMFLGFARQFSAAGRQRAKEHGAAGTAGTWLIFVSFVELAIGIGSAVAARRASGTGGGFDASAAILLGVGIVLFVVGVYLKIRGRRRARIYNTGMPGEALIRAVHETGTMVNNQPMYGFDLEVTGSGFAPTTTTHREVVPFWFASRVGPNTRVPVKVDPTNPSRLIFDWDRFAATQPAQAPAAASVTSPVDGSGFAQPAAPEPTGDFPGIASMQDAMQAARELTPQGSGWHVGKVIGAVVLLFVVAVVGGGLYFVSTIFNSVSDATNEVTEQVEDALGDAGGIGDIGAGSDGRPTRISVSRRAAGRGPVGYSLELPVGWIDATQAEDAVVGPLAVDLVMIPSALTEARIGVTRSVRFLEDPAPEDAGIASIRRELLAEYGDTVADTGPVSVAGQPGIRIDVRPGADGLRSRQVGLMRGGQVLFVSVTAVRAEWDATLSVFDDVLASWKWK